MDLEYKDKVAFVTGSSKGIGYAIATKLKQEGCKVIINGRDHSAANEAAFKIDADFVVGDICVNDNAKKVVDKAYNIYGRLDILVCNVGSGVSVAPGLENDDEWQRVMNLNLYSAVKVVSHARPYLKFSKGTILCISSICGRAALGAPIAYSAAKAALNSYVINSARYLAKENIRVNALLPGNVLFPGSTWETKKIKNPEIVETMLNNEVALKRFATVEEIANWAAFLCSSVSSFATGALFTVDGGQLRD